MTKNVVYLCFGGDKEPKLIFNWDEAQSDISGVSHRTCEGFETMIEAEKAYQRATENFQAT